MCKVWPQPSSGPGLARRGQRPRCIQMSPSCNCGPRILWLLVFHNGGVIIVEDTLLMQCTHQQYVDYNYMAKLAALKIIM